MTDSATLETHALPIAQYLVAIVDAAPFLMFRIPCVGNPGNYRASLRGRKLLVAVKPVLELHGLTVKQLLNFKGFSHPDDWCGEFPYRSDSKEIALRLQRAFAGGDEYPVFNLYDLNGDRFELARAAMPLAKSCATAITSAVQSIKKARQS